MATGADPPESPGDYTAIGRSGSQLCAISWGGKVATSRNDGGRWSYAGLAPVGFETCAQFVGSRTLLIGGSIGMVIRDSIAAPLP
jgi:hypothetical protein